MKRLRRAARGQVEQQLRGATPRFTRSPAEHEEFDLASWNELERLDPDVVTIGSHTMTHPILTSLTAEETEAETRDSRMALERRLDRPISVFCYPSGDLNDVALASARRYYHSALTVEPRTLQRHD